MKKKDFELIASILKETSNILYDENLYIDICNAFVLEFQTLYPKFQKDKFLLACGIELDTKKDNKHTCSDCGYIYDIK